MNILGFFGELKKNIFCFFLITYVISNAQTTIPFKFTVSNTSGSISFQLNNTPQSVGTIITWTNLTQPGVGDGSATYNSAYNIINITGLNITDVYSVSLNGSFNYIKCSSLGTKLRSIEQWGDAKWASFDNTFSGGTKLINNATDIPNLSACTSLTKMFYNCQSLVGSNSFNSWDVGMVTDFSYMFAYAYLFNTDLNNWNTSSGTNFSYMFKAALAFNGNIGTWDVSKGQNFSGMFQNATLFNQNLNNWNTASAQNFSYMFSRSTSLPGTSYIFNGDISSWNTSNVIDMSYMFYNNAVFNQKIGGWDTANVTNMAGMFRSDASNPSIFNQDIGLWNTSKVTNMSLMFYTNKKFNQNISNWNTANVTNMNSMFCNASAFNQNIGNWMTSKVTDMYSMFAFASIFNQNIENWDTSKVTNMGNMFAYASTFNQNLGKWNLKSINNIATMLSASGMSCINYDSTLIGWSTNINTPNGLSLGSTGRIYSSSEAVNARNYLISNKSWSIMGDSYDATCNPILAESDLDKDNNDIIYPNPAKDYFYIKLIKKQCITLYNSSGIFIKAINGNYGLNKINIIDCPKGLYNIIIGTVHKKLIIN